MNELLKKIVELRQRFVLSLILIVVGLILKTDVSLSMKNKLAWYCMFLGTMSLVIMIIEERRNKQID